LVNFGKDFGYKIEQLFERLSKISRRCGMGALAMRSSMGGSDASYTTSAGIPTADGLGIVGYNVHTVDEKAEIGSLSESAYFITEIIKELAKE
jgi:glutamate carboxypeptidase